MKFYKIVLSNKEEFEIDETEFEKVLVGLGGGSFVKIKQGIFNPSFVVMVIPIRKEDEKIIKGHIDEKTGKFIADVYEENSPKIKNEFTEDIKKLGDKFKI